MAAITTTFVRLIDSTEIAQLGEVTLSFNIGQSGASAYQSYLATTTDDPKKSEEVWAASFEQLQSDWEQGDNLAVDFIKNKPTIPTATSDLTNDSGFISEETDPVWNSEKGNYQQTSEKGANNGYAGLDSGGKVPLANLPQSLLVYKGVWNPETNTPTLTATDLTAKGWYYKVTGLTGKFSLFGYNWGNGDWAIYNDLGNIELSDNSDEVTSVNGQTGVVSLDAGDVGASPDDHDHSGMAINPDAVVLDHQYTDTTMVDLPVGAIFYNVDQLCWLLKLSTVNYYNFGEELPMLCKNGDASTHLEGTAVYISSGSGQLAVLQRTSSAIGKCNAIATADVAHTGNGRGYYCFFGMARSFPYANVKKSTDNENTWVDGAGLYLCDEPGKYSTTQEDAPAKSTKIGTITNRNGANITVMFTPDNCVSMDDLCDVDGTDTTIADTDEILKKDTAGLWKKVTWANVKTLLATWANGLYAKLSGGNTFSGTQNFSNLIQHISGQFLYEAASLTADTLNDRRFSVTSGVYKIERCTVANAAKGGGTWAVDITVNASGNFCVGGSNPQGNVHIVAPVPQFRLSQSDGAAGRNCFQFGISQSDNQFMNGAKGGDSNMVALSGGDYNIGTVETTDTTQILRFSILKSGSTNLIAGKYDYHATSKSADTINDTRTSNVAGVEIHEICTLGNATKGGGTWVKGKVQTGSLFADKIIPNSDTTGVVIRNAADGADFAFYDITNGKFILSNGLELRDFVNNGTLDPFIYAKGGYSTGTAIKIGNAFGYVRILPFQTGATTYFQSSQANIAYSAVGGGNGTLLSFLYNNTVFNGKARFGDTTTPETTLDVNGTTTLRDWVYLNSTGTRTTGDIVGDRRRKNILGVETVQHCTVAHATRGSGTYLTATTEQLTALTDSNELIGAGSFIDLETSRSGRGSITFGDGVGYADFIFTSAGVVTLIQYTSNVFTAVQTGTNHVIIKDNSTNVRIVNEMGSTINFNVKIQYN